MGALADLNLREAFMFDSKFSPLVAFYLKFRLNFKHVESDRRLFTGSKGIWKTTYSQTSMAQISLGPWKFTLDMGSSSY